MYKFIIFSYLVLSTQSFSSEISFDDLEKLVIDKNLHVKASEESVTSSERREGHFFRSLLPHVSLTAGLETFQRELFRKKTQPYGLIEAEMNLFRSGLDFLEESIREEELKMSIAENIQVIREELLKAQIEYWQILYLEEKSALLVDYHSRNQKNLTAAKRRISAGSAPLSDQMEFEMTNRIITQDLSKTKVLISNSKQKLNVLIGKSPQDAISIAEKHFPTLGSEKLELKEVQEAALPEVMIAQSASKIASLKFSQGIRWWAPKIDLYGGFKQNNMRESDEFLASNRQEYYVGAKVTFQIFDGGVALSESRSQVARARSLENKATQSYRELFVEFENSKAELRQLHEQVLAASKDVEIADLFLKRILSEYTRGAKSSSEVLSASDRSFEFQNRYNELKRDYQISKSKFLSLLTKEKK